MKRNVIILLGLLALVGSGCGRDASERFGTDNFVHAQQPGQNEPLSVSAPTNAGEARSSDSSGLSAAQQATAAHGPSAGVRAQMLSIKAAMATSDVIDDFKAALREGTGSEIVSLSSDDARVFDAWVSHIESGTYYLSRLKISRDAKFDRVEKSENGREKIRRYEVSFGGRDYVGWVEVKLLGPRWIIVGAGSYILTPESDDEDVGSDSVLDWFAE